MAAGILWYLGIAVAIWIGFDAHTLGVKKGVLGGGFADIGVAGWVICTIFLWIIAVPLYLAKRPVYKRLAEERRLNS
jgi:hypothetical protein